MWVAKIVVPYNEGMLLASRAKKHKINLRGYHLSSFKKGNKFFLLAAAQITGSEENKKAFLIDMKKDKRSAKIDMMTADFGFWLMEQHKTIEILYDPLILQVTPFIVSDNGDNIWEIASWHKEKLMAVAKLIQSRLYGGKLISMKRSKITSITALSVSPTLTDKQRRSLELAIENGYYGYPRKIEAQELAKLMKISTSTYNFHLRNAEKKILPYLFQRAIS